jgi:hypothetical protein
MTHAIPWDGRQCDDEESDGARMRSAHRIAGRSEEIRRRLHPPMTEGHAA